MSARADLEVAIRVLGDAEREVRAIGTEFRALGGHVSSAAPSFNVMAGAMAAGTVAANLFMGTVGGLLNLLKGSVSAGSEFGQSMANIRATLPRSDVAQFSGQLEALALKLGKDYPLSASEAGKAMEMLAQKGISASDILNGGAEAVVKLAAATGGDLVTASGIAAAALDTFGLDADDLGRATDVMTAAVLRGGMSVEDFGHALSAGGAAIKLAGGSIDDPSLGLAAMAKAGIEGADAGTSLKSLYTNLVPSTKAAKDAMKDLGLITKDGSNAFFDAKGNAKSFEEISTLLAKATKNLSAEEKIAAFNTIFGSDAMRAAAVAARLGAGEFGDLAEQMREQGIAAGAAAEKNDSLKGDVNSLTGTFETLQIVLARRLEPAMRSVVRAGNSLLGWVLDFAQSDAFTEWAASVVTVAQDLSGWFVDLGVAIADFSLDVLAKIPVVGEAFRLIGLTISGVVGAVGELLIGNFGGALDQVTEGSSDLVEAVEVGWPRLTGAIRAAVTFITGTAVPAWVALQVWLWDKLQPAIAWLTTTGWPALTNAARAAASFVTGTVVPAVQSLWTWLSTRVPPAVESVLDAFEAVKGKLTPIVSAIFGGDLKTALAGLGSVFADFATLVLGWVSAQVAKIDWAAVWGSAVSVTAAMVVWFAGLAVQLATWLGDRVKAIDWGTVWKQAKDVVADMADWFSGLTAKLASWIGDRVSGIDWGGVWAKARNVVAGMAQWFVTTTTVFAGWLGERVKDIDWQGVWSRAVDVASSMAQWFSDVATRYAGWISEKVAEIQWGEVWSHAVDVASHMAQWFLDAATRFTTWLGEQAAVIDWAIVWSSAQDVASHMGQWFIDLSSRIAGWVKEQLALVDWAAVWAAVVDAPETFADWLNGVVKNTDWAGIGGTIGAMLGATIRGVFEMLGTSSEGGDAADQLSGSMAKSLGSSLVSAITKIDVIAMQTALIAFWTGVVTKAWDEATKNWKPTIPNPLPSGGQQNLNQPISLPPTGSVPSPADFGPIDNSSRQAFVKSSWPYMLQAAGNNRDLAEMMLAAAISENGDIGKGGDFIGNNFFGIKGEGPAGSVMADTWEWVGGKRVNIKDKFAAYNNPVEGFKGFFDFLQKNSRYKGALDTFSQSGDAQQLFEMINRAGYATDPAWASKVGNIRANQVAPITGSMGAPQAPKVDLAGLNQQLAEVQAATKNGQAAWTGYTATITNVDEAVVSVTASLFREHGRLVATGQANRDLARDTLPTINALQQQGAISAETAEQLRAMALDILSAGESSATAQAAIGEATTVTEDLGTAADDTQHDYRDLASTFRTTRLDPSVDTQPLADLSSSAAIAQTALRAIDNLTVGPNIDPSQLNDLKNYYAVATKQAIDAIDDLPVFPGTNLSALQYLRQSEGPAVKSALAVIDDDSVTPQTRLDALEYLRATYSGQVKGAIGGIDDTPVMPQTVLDALEFLRVPEANAVAAAVGTIDDVAVTPVVNKQQLDDAAAQAATLAQRLSTDLNRPVNLAFSANVPQAVTVNQLTGTNTELKGVGAVAAAVVNAAQSTFSGIQSMSPTNLNVPSSTDFPEADFDNALIEINSGNAMGGVVRKGQAGWVGELGPEIFMPSSDGRIIANHQLGDYLGGSGGGQGGGVGGVVVNVSVTGNTMLGKERAVAQHLARLIAPELNRRVTARGYQFPG